MDGETLREPGPSWARPNWPVTTLDAVNVGLDPTEATIEQVAKAATQAAAASGASPDAVRRAANESICAMMLIRTYRVRGHLAAKLDPLGLAHHDIPVELTPAFHGFDDTELDHPIWLGGAMGFDQASIRELIEALQASYCGPIGFEYMHINDLEERRFIQERIEGREETVQFTPEGKRSILEKVIHGEQWEKFLARKYVGTKRFGLDGGESAIPALEAVIKYGGAYGVTDRLEIGGALPLVEMNIDGSRLNVYRGQSFVQASGTASASGMADVAVRAKYRLVATRTGGFAAAAEVRLPTGDEQLLLGAGTASLRLMGIGSVETASVGAHVNFSVLRGGVSDGIDGSGAITFAATPRVTLAGELLFRRLSDVRQVIAVSAAHPTSAGVFTERLAPGTATGTLSSAVTGIKWNARGTFVLTGEVLWRLGNAGLTAPFTPTISFDYLF